MFEFLSFDKKNRTEGEENEIKIDYAEVAKNRKEIEERKRKEKAEINLKNLSKEAMIKAGVEKARRELEKRI